MANKSISNRASSDATVYDPDQAQERMAQAEAMQSYGEKTGNVEIVESAIDKLCDERFAFLTWWDNNKEKGGRGKTVRRSAISLPDKDARSRWRKKHGTAEQNEATKETMKEKSRKLIDGTSSVQGNKVKQDEWYTPEQYIIAAKKVMGDIDLDPASNAFAQKTVMAAEYYSKDALSKDWKGRVWMNPPFSDVLGFANKLIEHLETGDVPQAIVLTNNNTDTLWWHNMATMANAICFTRGRISFYNKAGEAKGNTNGQTFFYFGPRSKTFVKVFGDFGVIR